MEVLVTNNTKSPTKVKVSRNPETTFDIQVKNCSTCFHYHACPVSQGKDFCGSEYKLWKPKGENQIKNPFNKPQQGGNHYKKGGTMDVAEWCERREHSPCQMNIVKYVDRFEEKDGIRDLRKAKQYLDFLAWIKYEENL